MRIVAFSCILVALLINISVPSPVESRLIQNTSFVHHHRHQGRSFSKFMHNNSWSDFGRWLSPPEAQQLLRQESARFIDANSRKADLKSRTINSMTAGSLQSSGVDCCPSIVEMVEPEGGKNMDGMYVELYRDGVNRQRFYEVSCRPEVEGKSCRFMDKKLHNQSKCVQKFSYTYALVKETPELKLNLNNLHSGNNAGLFSTSNGPEGSTWMLDYIEVRSGCSCVVFPKPRPPKRSKFRPPKRQTEKLDSSET